MNPEDHADARHRRMLLPDLNGYRAESRPEDAVTSDEKPETDVDPGEFWRMSGVNT